MNKYQEALNNIKKYGYDPSGLDREMVKYELDDLQELIDKQEKYKWHDLRKNPDDLPKETNYIRKVLTIGQQGSIDLCYLFCGEFKTYEMRIEINPIAWKEIERFE